jgi:uncharacterized surface protein with fasciclin (FAS1) repeats
MIGSLPLRSWVETDQPGIKLIAGLTDLLTSGGPHLALAPTDKAFASLPKDQLEALMANPKALGDFLCAYIVEGYCNRLQSRSTHSGGTKSLCSSQIKKEKPCLRSYSISHCSLPQQL